MASSANPKDLIREFKSKDGSVTTLIVKPEFFPAWTADDDQPYRVYDKSFSRLVVTIIQKISGGGKKIVSANIPVDELAGIYKSAENASVMGTFMSSSTCHWAIEMLRKITEPKPAPAGGQIDLESLISKAQGTVIANGALKGMSPYRAALEGKIQLLERQEGWLTDNLSRYPNNQRQIDAIKAALYLVKNQMLTDQDIDARSVFAGGPGFQETVVLLTPIPKGNSRKVDGNGLSPCQETAVEWHIGNRYPVEIRILNYNAPIRKDQTGRQNVVRREKQDDITISFHLDEPAFWDCCRLIKAHMNRFEQLYAYSQFKDADECEAMNRQKAGYPARAGVS